MSQRYYTICHRGDLNEKGKSAFVHGNRKRKPSNTLDKNKTRMFELF